MASYSSFHLSHLRLFLSSFTKNDKHSMVKAYGAAALAVVTKGPVGIVLAWINTITIYVCARL